MSLIWLTCAGPVITVITGGGGSTEAPLDARDALVPPESRGAGHMSRLSAGQAAFTRAAFTNAAAFTRAVFTRAVFTRDAPSVRMRLRSKPTTRTFPHTRNTLIS